MKKNYVVIAAMALALSMTACGSNSTPEATTAAATTEAATEAATETATEAASEEATTEAGSEAAEEAKSAEYTVYNTTGMKVTDLYLYEVGSKDKGENLAGDGLADGDSITITRDEDADKQKDIKYVLEFTTEDGKTQSFDTLSYEQAPISLKSVDAAAGATPIAFEAPEK